jgi:glycosyltransferase involved in cell wall biosynthesis
MPRRLLWHSNAPWARTGYGVQTRLFHERIHAAGYPTAISAFYGLQGATVDMGDIKVYPCGHEHYSRDVIAPHARHHFRGEPGIVFILADAWVIPPRSLQGLDVAFWTPVDHDPAPPMVVETLKESGAVPVAMSRHGERALRDAGLDPLYVPHAVDTTVFRPRDRREARAAAGLHDFPTDSFIVGMVAANKGEPSRKGFDVAIRAFAELRRHNENAYLYLHTDPFGRLGGVHLPSLLEAAGLPPEAVRFPDPYRYQFTGYSDEEMALLYSGMDVLLNPSLGEGFGVPVLEAQACGTPVIVTEWTAMAEVGEVGWHVQGQATWTNQRSWQMIPDLDQVAGSLRDATRIAGQLRDQAVEHAARYDVETVMTCHMLPALAECERRFDERRQGADRRRDQPDANAARADVA